MSQLKDRDELEEKYKDVCKNMTESQRIVLYSLAWQYGHSCCEVEHYYDELLELFTGESMELKGDK